MVMKMLMFDFRESEKDFFLKNELSGYDIDFIKEPLNEFYELSPEQLETTDIISVFITSSLTETILSKFKNLRVIATRSTGYNHINLKYCKKRNIAVFNVPNYGEKSVAQYTILLMLALIRKLLPAQIDMKNNNINYADYEGNNLESLTLGIVGCGAIGSAVAKLAKAFGMNIIVCSIEKNPEISSFVKYSTIEELYEKSDIISLHLPYIEETPFLIDEESINKMKDGVLIINTARGELLDIFALYKNLVSGKIRGVALDVLECENFSLSERLIKENIQNNDNACLSKSLVVQNMQKMKNVILTPHIAYNTTESVNKILKETFISLSDYFKGLHTNQLR